jgi:hypothetical protein
MRGGQGVKLERYACDICGQDKKFYEVYSVCGRREMDIDIHVCAKCFNGFRETLSGLGIPLYVVRDATGSFDLHSTLTHILSMGLACLEEPEET